MELLAENFYQKLILLILPDHLRLIQSLFISLLLLQLLILLELLSEFFLFPLNDVSGVIVIFGCLIGIACLISLRVTLIHLISLIVGWTLRILGIHILLLFGWKIVGDYSGFGDFHFFALQTVSAVGVSQMGEYTWLVLALGRPVSHSGYSVRVSLDLVQSSLSWISSLDVLSMERPVIYLLIILISLSSKNLIHTSLSYLRLILHSSDSIVHLLSWLTHHCSIISCLTRVPLRLVVLLGVILIRLPVYVWNVYIVSKSFVMEMDFGLSSCNVLE
jgi:hypothetical protein